MRARIVMGLVVATAFAGIALAANSGSALTPPVPANVQPGQTLAVTAKFYVERKKAPTKFTFSITSSVDVCGG